MKDNVVKFPDKMVSRPQQEMEGLTAEQAEEFSTDIASEAINFVIESLIDNGFNPAAADMVYFKDMALALETIRSAIFRLYGHQHVLQNLSENLFKTERAEDGNIHVSLLESLEDKSDNPGS